MTKETLELEPLQVEASQTLGVIGLSPGAGATTLCQLLERENRLKEGNARVLDLGENGGSPADNQKPDRLLVVADSRQMEEARALPELLEKLSRDKTPFGLVWNRCAGDVPELDLPAELPVFRMPELDTSAFMALYNFAFYS